MRQPVLPIPVSVPDLNETAPGLLSGSDGRPGFYCLWLSDDSRRAFATDGTTEVEVDYRRHTEWSEAALGEFSEEYMRRMPLGDTDGGSEPDSGSDVGVDTLDGFMHSLCLNLRNEPGHRGWSYLFDRRTGTSYLCVRWRAVEFCREVNHEERSEAEEGENDGKHTEPEVIERILSMEKDGVTDEEE
jgi:hypothetical protein